MLGKRMSDLVTSVEVHDLARLFHSACHVFGKTKHGAGFFRSKVEHAISRFLDQWRPRDHWRNVIDVGKCAGLKAISENRHGFVP
jgi:hypothetical protein